MSWCVSLSSFSANELGAENPVKDSREEMQGMVESRGGEKTTQRCWVRVAVCCV